MTVLTSPPRPRSATSRPPARSLRLLLVAATAALAAAGLMLGLAHLVRQPAPAVGVPVRTGFGAMTVVRVETGFVPSTQGPPTMRSMQGLDGATQLRVHVRLRGDSRTGAAPWRASLFRLSGVDGTAAPAGATLSGGTLVPGTAVDVQLWFDLRDHGAARPRLWLAYGAEEASQRVPLSILTPAASGHGSPSEDHHDHTTGTEGRR
jgi:hypothetical protein